MIEDVIADARTRMQKAMEALQLQYVTRLGASTLEELLAQLPGDQSPELWDRTQVLEIVREGMKFETEMNKEDCR